jgi:hypothetical protein
MRAGQPVSTRQDKSAAFRFDRNQVNGTNIKLKREAGLIIINNL